MKVSLWQWQQGDFHTVHCNVESTVRPPSKLPELSGRIFKCLCAFGGMYSVLVVIALAVTCTYPSSALLCYFVYCYLGMN